VICSLCHGSRSQISEDTLFDVMEMVSGAYSYSDKEPRKHKAVLGIYRSDDI